MGDLGKNRSNGVDAGEGMKPFHLLAVLSLLMVAMPGCRKSDSVQPKTASIVDLLIPKEGAYVGAYVDFGLKEDDVTLESIEEFERLTGKHLAIVCSSSYWGEQTFPTANVNLVWRHGSIPLIFWSPWDRPYVEDKGPDKFSITSVIAGKWDAYIDEWAESARVFGQPMFVSLANEMNGNWFPWSGFFYGADKAIPDTNPVQFEGPETFKKFYHYVIDRVRAKGATNIVWVYHAMNYSWPQEDWNMIDNYYPGADYVDWIGLSVYGAQVVTDGWNELPPLIDWPYREACLLDPNKPIMITEWGVGEFAKGSKAKWIRDGFDVMKNKYPRIKAANFWHERWLNPDGSFSNLRVNSSTEALKAYRHGVGDPYWIGRPILREKK